VGKDITVSCTENEGICGTTAAFYLNPTTIYYFWSEASKDKDLMKLVLARGFTGIFNLLQLNDLQLQSMNVISEMLPSGYWVIWQVELPENQEVYYWSNDFCASNVFRTIISPTNTSCSVSTKTIMPKLVSGFFRLGVLNDYTESRLYNGTIQLSNISRNVEPGNDVLVNRAMLANELVLITVKMTDLTFPADVKATVLVNDNRVTLATAAGACLTFDPDQFYYWHPADTVRNFNEATGYFCVAVLANEQADIVLSLQFGPQSKANVGLIVGATLGSIVGVAVIGAIYYHFYYHRKGYEPL